MFSAKLFFNVIRSALSGFSKNDNFNAYDEYTEILNITRQKKNSETSVNELRHQETLMNFSSSSKLIIVKTDNLFRD